VKRHPQDDEILAGGHGRGVDDIEAAYAALAFCGMILLAAIILCALSGCAASSRPTAHVPGDETSAGERPDRPRWDELRQQLGGM